MKSLILGLGLILLVAGASLLVLPYVPARPAVGTMTHVPDWPWASAGVLVLGLILLRRASK
ncbi:MAG TPA: hypothetical protein VN515_07390 [Terriglobales bacterium]|nr:hypothetical protein [Terriglobales bacterium]